MPVLPETSTECWRAVDAYLADKLIPADLALDAAQANTAAAGMPDIAVAPNFGKLLHLLARACGARRILEIGTLGGYSTIWLARALPSDGKLITLEYDPRHALVAQANIERADLATLVEIRIGAALDSLPLLAAESQLPFDLVFIDADKEHNADYVDWAVRLGQPGTLVIVDNVIRHGRILERADPDPSIRGVRHMFDLLASDTRLTATAFQTVGVKGLDGLAVAVVN